jgi:dihydropteroate synthase
VSTPTTPARLTLRDRSFDLRPGRPLVMGIVNANPDSFSDAVRHTTLEAQVALALALVAQGADLIDVGGESGVTYTDVTAAEVERGRVVPLVERLVAEGVCVSVDTWKAEVAGAALDAGAPARSGTRRSRRADRRGARGHAYARGAQAGALRRLRRRCRR